MWWIIRIVLLIALYAAGFYAAGQYIDGVHVAADWQALAIASLLFMGLHLLVRPILKLLFGPLIFLTLGIGLFLVDALLLYFLDILSPALTIDSVVALFLATLLLYVFSFIGRILL